MYLRSSVEELEKNNNLLVSIIPDSLYPDNTYTEEVEQNYDSQVTELNDTFNNHYRIKKSNYDNDVSVAQHIVYNLLSVKPQNRSSDINSLIISLYHKMLFKPDIFNVIWSDYEKLYEFEFLQKEIETIKEHYTFRGKAKIYEFLNNNSELKPILLEANKQIRKYFTNEELILEMLSIAEEEIWNLLVIKIQTKLSTIEARNKFKLFKKDWWLNASYGINDKLMINIEFV